MVLLGKGNQFTIRTDQPNVKVSWQVSGVRKDPFAIMHRSAVEEDKPEHERGTYLHPEAYGRTEIDSVYYARQQELQQNLPEVPVSVPVPEPPEPPLPDRS